MGLYCHFCKYKVELTIGDTMNTLEIYGTLGPSCYQEKTLIQLFKAGMNGMRLNLSHANLWDKKEWIDNFHNAANICKIKPNLLIDMKGPELRLAKTSDFYVEQGKTYTFDESLFPKAILKNCEVGDLLLIDDGSIHLRITRCDTYTMDCETIVGGTLKSAKSVAIKNKSISGDVLTQNDIENLKVAKSFGVSGLMQPFVRSAQDLIEVKNVLKEHDIDIKIYAKIENMEGVQALPTLFEHCDHIIIARGDLGNATGLCALPVVQHQIETLCKKHNMPYMVVTQMLHSMHENATPTRAEVSDIFHAVYNGASSIMLTGETAGGKYPVEAMTYFVNCAKEALAYKGE